MANKTPSEDEHYLNLEEAKEKLKTRKENMKTPDADGMIEDQHLTPSDDWTQIKSVQRITKSFRETFLSKDFFTKGDNLSELDEEGPTGGGNVVGIEWDQILHNFIQEKLVKSSEQEKIAESLLKALTKSFKGLTLMDSQFPLYGYMKRREDDKVFLWKGKADAIAWFKGRYVIVDWKAVDLNDYWDSKYGCGAHLHQCLVYAKLLQLQLELKYLPYILIVPISGFTGKQTHPGFFEDYAQGCKAKLNEFDWFVKRPENSKVVYLKEGVFKKDSHKMKIDGNTKLNKLFADGATVKDLEEAFGLPKLSFKNGEDPRRKKKIQKTANTTVRRTLPFKKKIGSATRPESKEGDTKDSKHDRSSNTPIRKEIRSATRPESKEGDTKDSKHDRSSNTPIQKGRRSATRPESKEGDTKEEDTKGTKK